MTIRGQYSVAELRDLIAAKDWDLQALGDHYASYSPTWVAQDPTTYVAWTNDWSALQQRYAAARSSAQTTIDAAAFVLAPDADIPAQDDYVAVLTALNPSYASNTIARGSLADLDARLTQASRQPTNYAGQPQPTPGSDADLNELNAIAPLDLLGQLTGEAKGPANPRGWPSWVKWGGVAAIAGGALYVGGQAAKHGAALLQQSREALTALARTVKK